MLANQPFPCGRVSPPKTDLPCARASGATSALIWRWDRRAERCLYASKDLKRVVVLEAHSTGGGETGQTTAHLASALDDGFSELERVVKLERAWRTRAIRLRLITSKPLQNANPSRATSRGSMATSSSIPSTRRRFSKKSSEPRVALVCQGFDAQRVPGLGFDTGPSRVSQPRTLPAACLFERACVGDRKATAGQSTSIRWRSIWTAVAPHKIRTTGYEVRADVIVVATNSPFVPRLFFHTKQTAYRMRPSRFASPKGRSRMDSLQIWQTLAAYVRIASVEPDFDELVVGGEDHQTGTTNHEEQRYERLEQWARKRFGNLDVPTHRWSEHDRAVRLSRVHREVSFAQQNPMW